MTRFCHGFPFFTKHDMIFMLPLRYWQQRGGVCMDSFLALVVAVAAGVACHYIIKWLDGDE